MRKLLIGFMSLLLLASAIWAQRPTKPEWRFLSVGDDTIYYIHNKRVITKRGTVRIWVKFVRLKEEDKGSKDIDLLKYKDSAHALLLWEFDCKSEMMKLISMINYSDEGNVSPENLRREEWTSIPPATNAEVWIKFACRK